MTRLVRWSFATLACFVLVAQEGPADAAPGQIPSIGPFLERCPQNDPAYAQIRTDFQLRRNGALVGHRGDREADERARGREDHFSRPFSR